MSEPQRQFGWSDLFLDPAQDPRSEGGFRTERDTLVGYLRDHRLTLELKCADLDAGELARARCRRPPCPCSGWFGTWPGWSSSGSGSGWPARTGPRHFHGPRTARADFKGAVGRPRGRGGGLAVWQAEVSSRSEYVAAAVDLEWSEPRARPPRGMVHMIEEYARHNGHADLLRERIDGRVGQ